MSHNVSGQSPPLQYNTVYQYTTSGILLLCGWAVGQLLKMLNIYWQSLSESISLHSLHSGHTLCGQPLDTGMPNHCMGRASAGCTLDVSSYHGPHIRHQFLLWVFLL